MNLRTSAIENNRDAHGNAPCERQRTYEARLQILVFNEITFDTYTSIPHKSAKFIALPAQHKHLLDAEYHANQLNNSLA